MWYAIILQYVIFNPFIQTFPVDNRYYDVASASKIKRKLRAELQEFLGKQRFARRKSDRNQ